MSVYSGYSQSGFNHDVILNPGGLPGLSGLLAIGSDQGVADLYNGVRSGNASDGLSYTIFRNDVQPREVVNAITNTDFAALTQIQLSKLQLIFAGEPIDVTLSGMRQNFQNIFSGTATLLSGFLAAALQRQGSRAEVLFGPGVQVTNQEVATVRQTSGQ